MRIAYEALREMYHIRQLLGTQSRQVVIPEAA
jgi:hypothetical protein